MDRKRLTYFTFSLLILILIVVVLFARGATRRSGHITLPDADSGGQGSDQAVNSGDSALNLVEITPETVQTAISTMSRPAVYSRTVTVETFWDGGSRSLDAVVYERNGLTRMDSQQADGSTRHLLTDGETTCLWYNTSTDWSTFPAGSFSQDTEQRLPTYEDILLLSEEEIVDADYSAYEGTYCIRVVTAEDAYGYATTYWISVDTGLLAAAETYLGETMTYRMQGLTVDTAEPDASLFLLPDGSAFST